MARPQSTAKAGFFPASQKAIAAMVEHLYCRLPNPDKLSETIQIIDPCAGEGLAVKQIAEALSIPNHRVYCVELDAARTEAIKANIPAANVIGPASFIGGVSITGCSFGVAYVNPPFDAEMGGGRREEETFCRNAYKLLAPHGIMVLVCPFKSFVGNRSFIEFFDSKFEDVAVYRFPDGEREYHEITVFGRKRRVELPTDSLYQYGPLHQANMQWNGYFSEASFPSLGQMQPVSYTKGQPSNFKEKDLRCFEIPLGTRPHTFKKFRMTDEELAAEVKSSPLNKHLKHVVIKPPAEPPLPLDKGHLGLILASGMLDGAVEGPYGVHVVRGSSHKVRYHNKEASTSEENPDTGSVTTKDVISERPVTVIRYVDYRGTIWTQTNNDTEKLDEQELLD